MASQEEGINNIFSDSDNNISIITSTSIDTHASIDTTEWGGETNNKVPEEVNTQLAGHVRRREDESPNLIRTVKTLRDISGNKRINTAYIDFNYLKFKSGEEYIFQDDDGHNLLLNNTIEPNIFVRKLLSRMPRGISNRLQFLSNFLNDEVCYKDEEDTDDEETTDDTLQTYYFHNFKECFYSATIKELKLRFIFKNLVGLWRVKKMENMSNRTLEPELDPITLVAPEKEVVVYDWNVKRMFTFDARSLACLIESKLLYQEYGFPMPLMPKNPKNNVEFSYKQLISLYFQLKQCGELLWGLTTLRQSNFNKNRWHLYHKSALTMTALKTSILLLDTPDGRELLEDFILHKMEELEFVVNDSVIQVLRKAMVRVPKHWYLEQCKALALAHYEAQHFDVDKDNIINMRCIKLFTKQAKFFMDLITNKII